MNISTQLKAAIASFALITATASTVHAGEVRDLTTTDAGSYTIKENRILKAEAKSQILTLLRNHESRQYHRLKTSTIRKVGKEWNISIKTLYGLKVATALVNAETGKITFKR